MSVVKMKKLTLVGLRQDKAKIFDELVRSKAIELKKVDDIEQCVTLDNIEQKEQLVDLVNRIENAVEYIKAEVDAYNNHQKGNKGFEKITVDKPSFARPLKELSYSEFINNYSNNDSYVKVVESVEHNKERRVSIMHDITKINQQLSALKLYSTLTHPTNYYKDTANTLVSLGTIPFAQLEKVDKLVGNYELVSVNLINRDNDNALLEVVVHIDERQFMQELTALGFAKTTFRLDNLPSEQIEKLTVEKEQLSEQADKLQYEVASCAKYVPHLRILCDYLELQYKKLVADSDLQQTSATFVLEGYYPQESEQQLTERLNNVSDCMIVHCEDVTDSEEVPTLVKNNRVVRNFETVTNMYTPPKYREVDPNPVMSIFYFVIFGLMVADMGYGLVLALTGLVLRLVIKQETGLRRIMSLFGVCGLSAIAVGALYGSAFSYTLYTGILPDASKYPTTTMVISLLLGIVHIMAGISLNMANQLRNKDYIGAFLVSFMWVLFFGGLFAFVLQPALQFMDYEPFNSVVLPQLVGNIGLYVMIGALVIIVFSAGYDRKGFGSKLIAGFGSLYGILNYFGDVMSYIRIFGLMLSSAMMGVVINDMSAMIASNGVIGIILSSVLLAFAHLFNLVIGILGVYIHDGRLQYVEFFGKFYTGDGKLFLPFGSDMKHTLIIDK